MGIEAIYAVNEMAALDSYMSHTCKYTTAKRRKDSNYKNPLSGWSYRGKSHISNDVDSLLINEWVVTKWNIHNHIDSMKVYGG